MYEGIHTSGNKKDSSDLDGALKRARGLYYKNVIARDSGGTKGGYVTFDSLSSTDRDAFEYIHTHRDESVPKEIMDFVDAVLESTTKERNE